MSDRILFAARAAAVCIGLAVGASAAMSMTSCSREDGLVSTWPATVEFQQLPTGQDRFSEHETNLPGTIVIVDHETGVCYLETKGGVTPLVDGAGEPMREAEAGE